MPGCSPTTPSICIWISVWPSGCWRDSGRRASSITICRARASPKLGTPFRVWFCSVVSRSTAEEPSAFTRRSFLSQRGGSSPHSAKVRSRPTRARQRRRRWSFSTALSAATAAMHRPMSSRRNCSTPRQRDIAELLPQLEPRAEELADVADQTPRRAGRERGTRPARDARTTARTRQGRARQGTRLSSRSLRSVLPMTSGDSSSPNMRAWGTRLGAVRSRSHPGAREDPRSSTRSEHDASSPSDSSICGRSRIERQRETSPRGRCAPRVARLRPAHGPGRLGAGACARWRDPGPPRCRGAAALAQLH